jgi:hypothetical protein
VIIHVSPRSHMKGPPALFRPTDVWGSGGIAPHIVDLGTRWGRVVSFTPRPLYPRGNTLHHGYRLDMCV